MSTSKCDEWFKSLVRKFPRANVVEDLLAQTPMQTKTRNADFFFNDRRLIGELKSLETSRIPRIQKVIDELRDRGELPIFYHSAPVSQIIKDHPDRQTLNKQFLMEIAKRLEKDFREANGQIRDTKAAFNIPTAKGFILITNSELQETTQVRFDEGEQDFVLWEILKRARNWKRRTQPRINLTNAEPVLHSTLCTAL
jgi:hypothetical protein